MSTPLLWILSFHVPQAALALVTLPVAALCRRPPRYALRYGGGLVLQAFVHVNAIIHASLWFLATPKGRLPSIADYVSLYSGN